MAESKTVAVVPLNRMNYATWKVQCKMALVKDGLWGIVTGTEKAPTEGGEQLAKFTARQDRALATIVLAVEPNLLYVIGPDPKDPVAVWKALSNQFQRKTWANKLDLKRKLFSMRLGEGSSMQDHLKSMTEVCDELSAIGEPVNEEDRVVYLLASLPESYNVLVTALEANAEVPPLDVVTERLLHHEAKMKQAGSQEGAALTARVKRCYFCKKPGHFKKNCEEYAKVKGQTKPARGKAKVGAFKVTITAQDESTSESEGTGLVVQHALSADGKIDGEWILDSGATCHMCNKQSMFNELQVLSPPLSVTLGDGRDLKATGRGNVVLTMNLPQGSTKTCTLHDVLLVPDLAYNLLSITAITKRGKVTTFTQVGCEIRDFKSKLVASGHREGNLYYLDQRRRTHRACLSNCTEGAIWHRRLGHLGNAGMETLSKHQMVRGMNLDYKQHSEFCESCAKGKSHRLAFKRSAEKRASHPLELVHSDICGKIGTQSLGGGEYFVTFVDDYTRHVWVYILKHKDEVFSRFQEWKAQVERSTGRQVKTLRSDNGGEYTSGEFTSYLAKEGIKHELTTPHTPQQNGIAERLNRTLIEGVRTMLADSKLPRRFWAEALSTMVYLRNRSPTKALEGVTPHEAWSGSKPSVSHLRIFGCAAYAHVPKAERRKLDSKTRKCVLLGYGSEQKGYRLYDLQRLKVIHSRDVVFDETSMAGTQIKVEHFPKYVELEVKEEPTVEQEEVLNHQQNELDGVFEEESEVVNEHATPCPTSVTDLRRSTRVRQEPDRYGHQLTLASTEQQDPCSVTEAMSSTDNAKWVEAMKREMESLRQNDVWMLVDPPAGRTVIGSKWVFKRKVNANGDVERYKARLVAQGYNQKYGLDYEETFSPVVRFESIRSVIALGAQRKLQLHQMDVSTAFLNGELTEEIYMRQPEGFVEKGKEHLVCSLNRSIYGLKQSPRCWNHALDRKLKEMKFKPTSGDPCLYVRADSGGEIFLVAVYVDDIILGGKNEAKINAVKRELSLKFEMKDLGTLHYFLGVKVIQDPVAGMIWIGQPTYTEKVLQRYNMHDCKAVSTPVNPDLKLVAAGNPNDVWNQQMYQGMVGSLLYLSTKTRPDIAYAVGSVARFCAEPTQQHWIAVKRILRYLKGTSNYGLKYKEDSGSEITGYSDADWGGDTGDRKSTSGYVFTQAGAAISWKSSKQTCVALSTAEAEYVALSAAVQEALWLQQLMSDLVNKSIREMTVHEDNQSTISLAKNQHVHGRTKHIDIKYHFIRDMVEGGRIKLSYCPTENMIADILTKGLSIKQFEKLRQLAGVTELVY